MVRVTIDTAALHRYALFSGDTRRMLDARMTPVQVAAVRQVGKRTGKLARQTVKTAGVDGRSAWARVGGGDVSLLHHEGTRPHIITPSRRRTLRFVVGSRTVFATRVRHPGTRPNRYLADNLPLSGGRIV